MDDFNANRSSRHAQKVLGYEVTKLVHGAERADSVLRITDVLFGGADYAQLTAKDFESLGDELGMFEANSGVELAGALVDAGLQVAKVKLVAF